MRIFPEKFQETLNSVTIWHKWFGTVSALKGVSVGNNKVIDK